MNFLKHKFISACIVLGFVCGSLADTNGTCSVEQLASCNEFALCNDQLDGNFTCTCQTNYTGDGLKNGSGCINNNVTVELGACSFHQAATCHQFARCSDTPDGNFTCTCQTNYTGDGLNNGTGCINNNVQLGACSFHQAATCHEFAKCSDTPDGNFTCTCKSNYTGDGLKNGTGCTNGIEKHDCLEHKECHANGHCNATCNCKAGFVGDGFYDCTNINECNENPCHEDGICQDSEGNFTCVCKSNFRGNGFNCSHFCSVKHDCAANAICVHEQCVCDEGYEGNGRFNCTDIDECKQIPIPCSLYANCTNTEGSFTCTCKNGYVGDGTTCDALPRTCHEIYQEKGSVQTKEVIDADGDGPLDSMEVTCEIRGTMGVTIMHPKRETEQLTSTKKEYEVEYEQSIEQIKEVANNSGDCYQEQKAYCRYNAAMLDGDDYYIDANDERHYTWGGSTSTNKVFRSRSDYPLTIQYGRYRDHSVGTELYSCYRLSLVEAPSLGEEKIVIQCVCGQIRHCHNKQSNCNCDGSVSGKIDDGKIIYKEQLPVTKVVMGRLTGSKKMDISLGPVICGPKPFGYPIDCHEAKFNTAYNIKKNSPVIIDIDQEGDTDPILVFCDMESHPNIGITTIPHDKDGALPPNTTVQYTGKLETIRAIVNASVFCRQDIVYECQNSPIMLNDNTKIEDTDGDQKDYWPSGAPGRCACGLLGACDNADVECNCDILDGERRRDMGTVTNKADQPVRAIISKNAGNASTYTLGPLRCSRQQFGYEADCQSYFNKDEKYSYPRIIDPDGPTKIGVVDNENVEPFLVSCVMVEEPPQGITIVYHEKKSYANLTGEFIMRYYYASAAQLVALRKRAVYCTQTMAFTCLNSPLFDQDGEAQVQWYDIEGSPYSYFNGKEGQGCTCGDTNSCVGGDESLCNCDSTGSQTREDSGTLSEKDDLPVMRITGNGSAVSVGPLRCYNNFPTCSDLYWQMRNKRLGSENMVQNGVYTIRPDGVEAFKVICKFPKTEIPLSPGGGTNHTTSNPDNTDNVTKCFDISYGYGISRSQIQAVVARSNACTQSLMYTCNNAPLIGYVHYKTCGGDEVPGFAGSNGDDKCQCGVTGTCHSDAGEVNDCNCQVEDSQQHEDGGSIHNKDHLAVCQVCITLGPVNDNIPSRSASYQVSSLYCSSSNIGVYSSCQAIRDSTTRHLESGTYTIDIDGFMKGLDPFIIYCEITAHPPAGIMRILRKTPEITPIPKEGTNTSVLYFVVEFTLTKKVVEESVYCEQEVYVLCPGKEPPTERTSHDDWIVTANGTIECKDGACSCVDGGIHGGFVKVQDGLPVQNITLGPSEFDRQLYVGELRCFNIYKDCHDIKINNAANGWYRGHKYPIDPDGAGGLAPFEVTCDFKTDPSIGITVVKVEPGRVVVQGQLVPRVTNMTYPTATPEQIHGLTTRSGYCSQGIQFECEHFGLINSDGYYTTFNGGASPSFGTGSQSDIQGCPCTLTKTCPEETVCRCDAKGPMTSYDNGLLTDKDKMPIQSLHLGDETTSDASATATIGDVRCAPKPFDLYETCEDAFEDGKPSGEFMIWPNKNLQPFFVYCDMTIVPGHGVIVIGHNRENPSPFGENSTKTVTYNSATPDQVKAVTTASDYCYQTIKFDCYNTHFLAYGKFYWTNADGVNKYYLGQGDKALQQCSCAADYKTCGGDQIKSVLQTRKCSCDAGELQLRSDAGTFSYKEDFPLISVTYLKSARVNESMEITLGKLYCAQVEFDIDECATNMHDCHENATCINKPGKFECACKPGWQGRGRSGVWANGRNCYDDNECAELVCPSSATCENTPGSFICHCKPGYTKTAPTTCKDIDECNLRTDNNCDHDNAICTNLPGTFQCRCKRGFKGNGTTCKEQRECSCFGDPHCISYDTRILHFQGDCQYILSQDGCSGSNQTFQILGKFWNKGIRGLTDATWIETVTLKLGNHVVILGQDHSVLLNGVKRNLPARTVDGQLVIRRKGHWTEVQTIHGVHIKWNGQDNVQVNTAPSYKNKLCGLCGNYNDQPEDDWKIGPACQGQGQITSNPNKFGQSYTDIAYKNSNPQCTFDCNQLPPTDPCTGDSKAISEYYCNKIFKKDGPFKSCLAKLEDQLYNGWKESCVYDLCKVEDNREAQLCKSAENLERECQGSYNEGNIDWRTDEMCAPSCDADKIFLPCATENNTKSCDSRTFEVTGEEHEESCTPGCYCREGLVMDGNKCVLPEQCGCLYSNFYYSVEQSYVDKNCTTVYTCQSDKTFSPTNLTCHENATCGLTEGVYGCHCNRGYIGNGSQCEFDPCGENDCNVEEECVPDGDSYKCKCLMGYQGDCNSCEDIDECATRTHDCPPHSRCHNTPGSFRCVCIEGYTPFDKRCKDINECEIGNFNCPSGTKCYNTPGKYHCEPCSDNSPAGKCCACYGAKCDKPGEICGTDSKTYNTEADLIIAVCETGKKIHVDYKGSCKDSCNQTTCPKWQTCDETSTADGAPTCKCEPCTPSEINSTVEVCSNKLDLYINMCQFKKIQCAMDREDIIIVNTTSPCTEKNGTDITTEWSPWTTCSVSCGNGTTTRHRHAVVEFDEYLEEKYPLNVTSSCFRKPCPGSPCATAACNVSQVCYEDGEEGVCTCPDCTYHGEDPVCGKIGNQYSRTYDNPCDLTKKACEEGEPYEQLYFGKCGTKPVNCSVMPNFLTQGNDKGCLSLNKFNVGQCDGACGQFTDECCIPTRGTANVTLSCNDQTPDQMTVDVIESCECRDLEG